MLEPKDAVWRGSTARSHVACAVCDGLLHRLGSFPRFCCGAVSPEPHLCERDPIGLTEGRVGGDLTRAL